MQFASALDFAEGLVDGFGNQPLVVASHAHRPHAQVAQDAEINEISRRGTEHDVARVEQRVGQQVQHLVAAGRQHYLVGRKFGFAGGRAVRGNQLLNHGLAQPKVARRGAVLQGRSSPMWIGQ